MVRVTFTVDGDAEEVIDAIRRLAGGSGSSLPALAASDSVVDEAPAPAPAEAEPAPPPPPVEEPEVPEGTWTIDHVRTLWGMLAPAARDIYRQVAQSSGYIMSRESLLDAMGLTSRELSGRLSSQGHAIRRLRRHHNVSLPHPLSFDAQTEEYRMRPDVAGPIIQLNL